MSKPTERKVKPTRVQTPITPVIPPDATALTRFWHKYFVFPYIYWRSIILVLFILSLIYVWPYAAIITRGEVSVPIKTLTGDKATLLGYPSELSNDAISLIVNVDQYAIPGKGLKVEFYLKQNAPLAKNDSILFKVLPETTSKIPAVLGEAVLVETDKGVWQATSILLPNVPSNFEEESLDLNLQVEVKRTDTNETPPVFTTLTIQNVAIPVAKWPSYIVQLLVFLGSLGFFGIDQVWPALKGLFQGRAS